MPALALDDLLGSAGVDPRHGVQIVDVEHLVSIPFDPGLPLVLLRGKPQSEPSKRQDPVTSARSATHADPPGVSLLPGRHKELGASRLLMRLYPGAHLARRIV
ncbi:MAG: hypothetical protein E6I84_15980, partial [Chloroflexi bacterium]